MQVAVKDVFLGGKLKMCQEKAKPISNIWQGLGGKLAKPTETNMVWLELNDGRADKKLFQKLAKEMGLIVHTKERLEGRLVVHYQICGEAIGFSGEAMAIALN